MSTKLRVLDLAIAYHRECEKLQIKAYLKNQLVRASSSVALNISEGNSRSTTKDRRHFFRIAYASLKESETALLLANVSSVELFDLSDYIGGSLYNLIRKCI